MEVVLDGCFLVLGSRVGLRLAVTSLCIEIAMADCRCQGKCHIVATNYKGSVLARRDINAPPFEGRRMRYSCLRQKLVRSQRTYSQLHINPESMLADA
jgi:hypothetical protein